MSGNVLSVLQDRYSVLATFPDAGFSLLHGIAPMGTKFQIAQQLGVTRQAVHKTYASGRGPLRRKD